MAKKQNQPLAAPDENQNAEVQNDPNGPQFLGGPSAARQTTNATENSIFYEFDTGKRYRRVAGVWNLIDQV